MQTSICAIVSSEDNNESHNVGCEDLDMNVFRDNLADALFARRT
jgi:hypothetical protein